VKSASKSNEALIYYFVGHLERSEEEGRAC
jgi:hypothetical protein